MSYLVILGQILLALYFVIGAVSDVLLRQAGIELMMLKKIPWPKYLYYAGVALKFVAGLALLLNFFSWIAAIVLALFTLIANIIFNNFWQEPAGMKRLFSLNKFLCNLAVIGGLLLVVSVHL